MKTNPIYGKYGHSKTNEIIKAISILDHHLSEIQYVIGDLNYLVPQYSGLPRDVQGTPEGMAIHRYEILIDKFLEAVLKRGYISLELKNAGVV